MKTKVARCVATVAGLGDLLPAPGTTVGSVVGVALFALIVASAPGRVAIVATACLPPLSALAVWACGAEARRRGVTDPQAVVFDETAGQWVALTVVAFVVPVIAVRDYVSAFLLFRFFDIVKPWPVSRLERLPGGWGIVADDLAAGMLAGLLHSGVVLLIR